MRISTPQMYQGGLSAMQRAQSNFNKTSLQMSTGRSYLTPSDDPNGAAQTVQLDTNIKKTEQYQRNNDLAKPRLEQEEAQIVATQNVLQRVRELVVAGNNDTYIKQNRTIIASEIRKLREDIIGIANLKDANDEYLFAGARSHTEPFVTGTDGKVSYVGAIGAGSVREVSITNAQNVAIGDTGSAVFMEIPERSGLLNEAVPKSTNTGTLYVNSTSVTNLDDALNSSEQTLRIRFSYPPTNPGPVEYDVLDLDGNSVRNSSGDLISGIYGNTDAAGVFVAPTPSTQSIELAGRMVTITGEPADGDELISRPVSQVTIFQTLDDIATAFEDSLTGTIGSEALSRASSIALRNIDSGLGRLDEVRTTVGLRISTLEMQTGLNDERVLDLSTTLSDVRDLDYADAISRFKLQEAVLEAAQQTYVKVNKLSLFDFL
ncbi:flagellar hook-associated protein FlgL [Chromatium okenii]|uniref:flagellar hook-associated protein FlgL n=1 Tax=Chromatium okenii TaxID=61644 RepID=UPI0026F082AC|nr:flagellar hook-associated protein FlgL [Chromatium okenii]MBV5308598.1 flagellar hook-associated protein FlgL [Chromatium okenii]